MSGCRVRASENDLVFFVLKSDNWKQMCNLSAHEMLISQRLGLFR